MAENAVAIALARRLRCDVQHANGLDGRGDLTANGRLIEVKMDLLAQRTGRIAVELARDGRPSGIATSIAETVVYVLPPSLTARMLPREALLALADVSPVRTGGDGGRTRVALVPLPLLLEHSTPLQLAEGDARRLADAAAAAERGRRP